MENKKPWLSKTIWLNSILGILAAVAAFLPSASSLSTWISGNASLIGIVWSVVGLALRAVTKDKISLGE